MGFTVSIAVHLVLKKLVLINLGSLYTKFDNWSCAIEKFDEYKKNKYHLTAILKVDGFL